MGFYYFLCLGDEELPVIIQQPVQGLKDVGGGKVQLVQDYPIAFAHGINQDAYVTHKLDYTLVLHTVLYIIHMSR